MLRKAARGFTLIELMIVVAIIGILAAIAIPNFMRYQLRSKRTEGSVNVAGLRTAEIAYYGTHDVYVATTAAYPAAPGAQKQAWDRALAGEFTDDLGWAPEGQVYGSYMITTGDTDQSFFAAGATNLDADADTACWGYAKPTSAGAMGAALPGLGCTGAAVPASAADEGWEKVELLTGDDIF